MPFVSSLVSRSTNVNESPSNLQMTVKLGSILGKFKHCGASLGRQFHRTRCQSFVYGNDHEVMPFLDFWLRSKQCTADGEGKAQLREDKMAVPGRL